MTAFVSKPIKASANAKKRNPESAQIVPKGDGKHERFEKNQCIGITRGKIHAVVDAQGNPIYVQAFLREYPRFRLLRNKYRRDRNYMKQALITGITGQDGSFLAELLLNKGYEVHGIIRRSSVPTTSRINHIIDKLIIHEGDLTDSSSIIKNVLQVKPDEIYNLAAQSHVQVSFEAAEYTGDVDALGVLRILEAVHNAGLDKTCKIYQASTSELYGKVEEVPQSETTLFHPYSPYAIAKQYGFWMIKQYREAYGMFACNGILFNHESERRGETFVTRKITRAAGRIAVGLQDHLELGNLDSLRDWGYAKDYVECMWLILQQDEPDDYVIATGVQHTVREFTALAFKHVGIDLEWRGEGVDEKGYDKATGKMLVSVNEKWYRPTDVVNLCGDPTKAKTKLGWNPQKTSYEELCRIMAEHDLQLAKKEAGLQ